MNIIDKHRCINSCLEHQNNLSDNSYFEPASKDPKGPEGPQATPEMLDDSEKFLKSKDSDVFKIGEHVIKIIIK